MNDLAFRRDREAFDEILQLSGLDQFILEQALQKRRQQADDDKAYHRGLANFIQLTQSAFPIGILRAHKGCASIRNLEITLADSPSKGLESQRQELRWVMLAHNLRALARKRLAKRAAREEALAA